MFIQVPIADTKKTQKVAKILKAFIFKTICFLLL